MTPALRVEPMTRSTLPLANAPLPAFPVSGRAVSRLEEGVWRCEWDESAPARMKRYPAEDYTDWLGDEGRQVLLALTETGACAGLLAVSAAWNGWGWIDCLYVHAPWRGRGAVEMLFRAAEAWARERRLIGLGLETQDINLPACRFYARMGMVLSGANGMVYRGFPEAKGETALYWYLPF